MREWFRSYEVSATVAVAESTEIGHFIDSFTAPQLREVLIGLIDSGHYRLVMDLRQVDFLSSDGLGVLVGALKRARAHDGMLALAGLDKPVLKVFRMTGLTKVFPIFESLAEAVAWVSVNPLPKRVPAAPGPEDADEGSHWFAARVYTSEENAGPRVDESLREVLDAAGFEIVLGFPPERGSWFRESIVRKKDSTARPTRDEALDDLARVIRLYAAGQPPENADQETNQAVADFLVALDKTPEAIAQVYSLMVVKVRDTIMATRLNRQELNYLSQHPGLARNPGRALRVFRRPGSGSLRAAAATTAVGRDSERFLECHAPSEVRVGSRFEIRVRVTEQGKAGRVAFGVPAITAGRVRLDVLLDVPPGCRVLSCPVAEISLPATGDSDQACFMVSAPRNTGQYRFTVRVHAAAAHGFELACAQLVTTVSKKPTGPSAVTSRPVRAGAASGAAAAAGAGANLTVIRSGPATYYHVLYRTGHSPVIDVLRASSDPRPRLRRLTAELSEMAGGGAGWRPAGLRDELRARGGDLWRDFLPDKIQGALGELSPGEHTLMISCQDTALGVPWELMHPIERIGGHTGFLAELFDVVRAPCGAAAWCGEFALDPAVVVLPDRDLPGAAAEARGIGAALGLAANEYELVGEKTRLQAELRDTPFGLLHVTAHHRSKVGAIAMAARQSFAPADLNEFAGDGGAWSDRRPLVFVNACGTARAYQRFTQYTSWAQAFFEAGAGGFVGSMWDVRSDIAGAFAQRFYQALYGDGQPFGGALRVAREHCRSQSADPTWLAYAAHGDPAALALTDAS